MPRRRRLDSTGVPCHVLNRAAKRMTLFATPEDYRAFEHVLEETLETIPLRLLAFCLMPNHWHFVAWPDAPGQLSRFMQRLSHVHAMRWNVARGRRGEGAVYQGRFKSFPVQANDHLVRTCRYVERNALRAGLVERAEDWRWGSLWQRVHGCRRFLSEPPFSLPEPWVELVNAELPRTDIDAIRRCARRGTPYGAPAWRDVTARAWGLGGALRRLGRPPRPPAERGAEGGAF